MGAADYQSVLLIEDRLLARRRVLAGYESRAFLLDVALIRSLGGGVTVRSFREPAVGDGMRQPLPVASKSAEAQTATPQLDRR